MTLSQQQQDEILSLCRSLIPTIEWAPEECWIEEGENERKVRRNYDASFFSCQCIDRETVAPPILTFFLKCDWVGQGRGLVYKMQKAVERYLEEKGVVGLGCANCEGRFEVDVRLFPRQAAPEVKPSEEFYQEGFPLHGGDWKRE